MWAGHYENDEDSTLAEYARAVQKDHSAAPLYFPFALDHTIMLLRHRPLFVYGPLARIKSMVDAQSLRVSAGAMIFNNSQRGAFPPGPYATTLPPYDEDDTTKPVLSRLFYGYDQIAHPSPYDPARPEADVSHWLMFYPSRDWKPTGYFKSPGAEETGRKVVHWVLPTHDTAPGTFVAWDIVAYGRTMIPDTVAETNWEFVEASETEQKTWYDAHLASQDEPGMASVRAHGFSKYYVRADGMSQHTFSVIITNVHVFSAHLGPVYIISPISVTPLSCDPLVLVERQRHLKYLSRIVHKPSIFEWENEPADRLTITRTACAPIRCPLLPSRRMRSRRRFRDGAVHVQIPLRKSMMRATSPLGESIVQQSEYGNPMCDTI